MMVRCTRSKVEEYKEIREQIRFVERKIENMKKEN
jgi:hypothetical protein